MSHGINFQAFCIIISAHASSQGAESPDRHVTQSLLLSSFIAHASVHVCVTCVASREAAKRLKPQVNLPYRAECECWNKDALKPNNQDESIAPIANQLHEVNL